MEHGFTRKHFELLRRWGGHHYDAADDAKLRAYERLKEAYAATERWARALQKSLFGLGRMELRKATINQSQAFSPYTWARIYPAASSPKELAFTVGIDADGFTVKIDTVGNTPVRAAYVGLRGPQNEGSPFAEILPVAQGLALSLEQLVAWSAEATSRFRMGYGETLERIGLAVPKLSLVTDEEASKRQFAAWRQHLIGSAVRRGALFWLLEGSIVLRPTRSGRTADDDGMDLGVDPTGQTWAVQINEPRIAGNYNSASAIAMDGAGERYLLRQGLLRPNEPGGHTISGEEFVSRTGLAPVPVQAEGLAARRLWFVVCNLEHGADDICRETSGFVDRCAAARVSADRGEAPQEADAGDQFSGAESGGTYSRAARPAEERIVLRRQGTVWLALAEILTEAGVRIRKGRHALGFEVDAEIDGGGIEPLLVEIKSGASSSDVHGGVGQLHLYPQLIQRLARYERALLLPRLPAPAVCRAVEACGIAIHTFELDERDGKPPQVTFSREFLRRCGVGGAA